MKNQGEIISLIVFVILTLALGVTTYFGFDKSSVTKAELESAKSELANATESADALAANLAIVKTRAGFQPEDKGADIVAAMSADVAAALGAGSENLSYKAAVAQLQKNISTLDKQISDVVADRDLQIKNANSSVALAVQQQTKYAANVDAQQKAQETAQADARQNYDKLTQDFVDQTKRFDSVSRQARDAIQTANAETQENREIATRFANINIDLSKRIDELTNVDFSREDARVVSVDQVSKIVRLNVGSAQGVRPLMEFNVYPYDVFAQGEKVAKGKLQVIRTIQDDACEAKIISDENGAPVQPGDLVYTSLWSRGEVMRYALSLRLDVNNDGKSDLSELLNLVEANGFQVAAYLDDSGEMHGKIGTDVDRVVVPDLPILSALEADASLTPEERARLESASDKFLADARANGVREMKLSDFLIRMDYKETDQVVRNAGESSVADLVTTNVGSAPAAAVFRSSDKENANLSEDALKNATLESQNKESAPADTYFRKRAPNL